MSRIAVRLSEQELRRLDSAVSAGVFRTRADAVRTALGLLEDKLRDDRIADSYRMAYARAPLSGAEAGALDAALVLALGLDK